MHAYAAFSSVACSKRSDSGERCEVKKAMKSRGELGREVRFPLSPLPRLDRRQHTYVFVTCHVFKVEFTVQSKQLPGSFFFTTSSTM